MQLNQKILSDIGIFMKYAKYVPEKKKRESWEDICNRYQKMMISKYPSLKKDIIENLKLVREKKVLMSMRAAQFAGKPIEISPNRLYNCLGKETSFITINGVKSFEDFNDGDETVVLTHKGNWKKAIVRSYGEQQLKDITFRRAKSSCKVRATANHRWLLYNNEETTNLSIKDIIIRSPKFSNFDYDNAGPIERLYWCYGYVFGDGTTIKLEKGDYRYSLVRLCGHDAVKFTYRFEEMGFKTSTHTSLHGDFMAYTGSYLKTLPDLEKDGLNLIKAFVDGYLSADGNKSPDWYANNTLSRYKGIQSSNLEAINFLRKALPLCGYYISSELDLTGQKTNYGIRPYTIKFAISNSIGNQSNKAWSVHSIENSNIEEVWCLEVEDDHSFVLSNGLVTGNCAFLHISDYRAFSEVMFLLLGGSGVGYSVQKKHISELPEIQKPTKSRRFLVDDSIQGWADAVNAIIKCYFGITKAYPDFDFRDIRPKGSRLITSGGKAPGHQPLEKCLFKIKQLLDSKTNGSRLESFECHLICCYIADAVLAGGIRRAALSCLFDFDDNTMLYCKSGNWWELYPELARCNNSAVILRHKIKRSEWEKFWSIVKSNKTGEPGFVFSNNADWGFNPCYEISLRDKQFCNLTTINVSNVESEEDFYKRCETAAFFGTLQAGFTEFHYLREGWQIVTEKEALIGVSQTGVASFDYSDEILSAGAKIILDTNEAIANKIGINCSSRCTTIKPEGTASIILGSSSGIHAWDSEYYIRRIRVGKNESIYPYLKSNLPDLIEDDVYRPDIQAVISIPQKAPEGSIIKKKESALSLLERAKNYQVNWVREGHRKGDNYNNVSITVNLKEIEWDEVGQWIWSNKDYFSAISVLPEDLGTYVQAPFEEISKEKYEEMELLLKDIDLSKVIEDEDNTTLTQEVACGGSGSCEIT